MIDDVIRADLSQRPTEQGVAGPPPPEINQQHGGSGGHAQTTSRVTGRCVLRFKSHFGRQLSQRPHRKPIVIPLAGYTTCTSVNTNTPEMPSETFLYWVFSPSHNKMQTEVNGGTTPGNERLKIPGPASKLTNGSPCASFYLQCFHRHSRTKTGRFHTEFDPVTGAFSRTKAASRGCLSRAARPGGCPAPKGGQTPESRPRRSGSLCLTGWRSASGAACVVRCGPVTARLDCTRVEPRRSNGGSASPNAAEC